MEIIKVVLTGGPCAGKTTALNSIREYLAQNNISFVSVPETATELILNEIKPLGEDTIYKFQSLVFKKQLSKEQIAEEYLREVKQECDKCVIIYDRGIIDNKAYLSGKDDFKNIVKQSQMTEIDILDSYDLVLDLISTARCKQEVYNMLNKARMEDIKTAIKVDEKTSLAWMAHRNLKIITSSMSLEEETKIIIEHIKEILSGVKIKELERLLIDDNKSNYDVYTKDNSETIYSTKIFLETNDSNYNYTLEIRNLDGYESYIYKVYKEEDNKQIILEDRKISKYEYNKIINEHKIIKIVKTKEIYFIQNMQNYKLCFYNDKTILEVEENKLNNNLIIPDNLKIVKERNKCRKRSLNNGYI